MRSFNFSSHGRMKKTRTTQLQPSTTMPAPQPSIDTLISKYVSCINSSIVASWGWVSSWTPRFPYVQGYRCRYRSQFTSATAVLVAICWEISKSSQGCFKVFGFATDFSGVGANILDGWDNHNRFDSFFLNLLDKLSLSLLIGREAMRPDLFSNLIFMKLNHPFAKAAREHRRKQRAKFEAKTRLKKSKERMIRTAIQAEEVDDDDWLIFIQNSLLIFFLLVGSFFFPQMDFGCIFYMPMMKPKKKKLASWKT